jgi:hypothetical protein
MMSICTFLIIMAIIGHHQAIGMRQQAVAVKGIVLCGGRPASGVKVKLWDEVGIGTMQLAKWLFGQFNDFDRMMVQTRTMCLTRATPTDAVHFHCGDQHVCATSILGGVEKLLAYIYRRIDNN